MLPGLLPSITTIINIFRIIMCNVIFMSTTTGLVIFVMTIDMTMSLALSFTIITTNTIISIVVLLMFCIIKPSMWMLIVRVQDFGRRGWSKAAPKASGWFTS